MTATRLKKLYNHSLLPEAAFVPATNWGSKDLKRAMERYIERNGWTALDTVLASVRSTYTGLALAPVVLDGETAKLNVADATLAVGKTITAIPPLVDGIPAPAITYQWQANLSSPASISGATSQSLLTTGAHLSAGPDIRCAIIFTGQSPALTLYTPWIKLV